MKGTTIREGLARVRVTQTELARLLGITPQAVAGILAASDVRTGTVERICEVLHLPITYFYDVPNGAATDGENVKAGRNGAMNEVNSNQTGDTMERDREIQYLRGQVAAYEAALTLLRHSPDTSLE
ncbi:MAG: helix-turn-helix domain-containing protein [Bacteroidales bacterium]|nr:helix-turn-helix domain-containing protein [Bacteroidales bacterium]